MDAALFETYKGKNVLITGGLGFIGSNLAGALNQLGANVTLVGRRWPDDDQDIADSIKKMPFWAVDLVESSRLESVLSNCDIVFNLAAKSGAEASNLNPISNLEDNCKSQLAFLDACRRFRPGLRVVYASSRLVYSPEATLPVSENSMTDPISVYGVHKLIVEKYHKLYSHHYGMEHVILRITNPYGPGQRKGARGYGIINLFINLAISGHTLSVYGDGSQLRDYIHINDVVEAFLTAGVHPRASGQTFNVGSGRSVSFLEMAKLVITLTNSGKITQVPWPESALKVETGDFYSDIASIQHILGWNPKISLEAGLRDAISRIKQ